MNARPDPSGEIYCVPKGDPHKRFVIGIPGRRNLLCIGLNPNTADANRLDGTSRNFMRIAKDNGFDGWILVNLYPARNPKAGNLNDDADDPLFTENLERIEACASSPEFGIEDVLLGWGNDVEKRAYLKNSVLHIHQRLKAYPLNFHCFRVNRTGHPGHPSPMTLNTRYKRGEQIPMSPFDFEGYIRDLAETDNPGSGMSEKI